jgi:hypothetical protein
MQQLNLFEQEIKEVEAKMRKAQASQDAHLYYRCVNFLGLQDPEDIYLYELGAAEEIYQRVQIRDIEAEIDRVCGIQNPRKRQRTPKKFKNEEGPVVEFATSRFYSDRLNKR